MIPSGRIHIDIIGGMVDSHSLAMNRQLSLKPLERFGLLMGRKRQLAADTPLDLAALDHHWSA